MNPRDLHFDAIVVDCHADTIGRQLDKGEDLTVRSDNGHIDLPRDRIDHWCQSKHEGNLSHSETAMLSLWRLLFSGRYEGMRDFNFSCLGPTARRKARFLMSESAQFLWKQ